jgi:hypothetical protein
MAFCAGAVAAALRTWILVSYVAVVVLDASKGVLAAVGKSEPEWEIVGDEKSQCCHLLLVDVVVASLVVGGLRAKQVAMTKQMLLVMAAVVVVVDVHVD